ncbi:4-(cytidine 5'-diphospho)-2-C-methyl-D-erythritol kinase [Nibricoccus aquaticus]|uniref:4-(cytidine 5'-diphospho)-2-C-methyl-D-erythritol kinase n=1 Tax=Nibricoccus aquaticus TaxID=2576891 RepID=UPI001FEA0694|nr:4-(cytidine 5'-diphospho)-2-C-methyl-D-erythritol kinase [Nibricoccus aquaticus]
MSVFSPAKINLFLAITGRRADGFHELVSVVAPLEFGDELRVEADASGSFSLTCDVAEVPVDETNLVLRAAKTFREASGWTGGAKFSLTKRVPMGAGLGGGSSNATAALRALNALAGGRLGDGELAEIAAGLGSDCVLFLREEPLVMRGRGERIEALPEEAAGRLSGRRLLVFKPAFGIATAWAYGEMVKAAPGSYLASGDAEARLAAWIGKAGAPAEELLFNNMEAAAFRKYVALPVLLTWLKDEFGVAAGMSGSGSACYALLRGDSPVEAMVARIREALGGEVFVVETRIG